MNINKRVNHLRTSLGLTQTDFADTIGITQGTLSSIENGDTNLSERNIKFICSEFRVNEEWLRTGNGPMFDDTEQTLLETLGENIDRLTEIEKAAVIEFIKLPSDQREVIMNFIKKMTT